MIRTSYIFIIVSSRRLGTDQRNPATRLIILPAIVCS